tara:strand:+ start:262 stop:636 length:375 start_codon:yes stop_codon:yes gene_type:complete
VVELQFQDLMRMMVIKEVLLHLLVHLRLLLQVVAQEFKVQVLLLLLLVDLVVDDMILLLTQIVQVMRVVIVHQKEILEELVVDQTQVDLVAMDIPFLHLHHRLLVRCLPLLEFHLQKSLHLIVL